MLDAFMLVLAIVALGITVWSIEHWRENLSGLHRDCWGRLRYRRLRCALSWDFRLPPAMSAGDWHDVASSLAKRYGVEPIHQHGRALPVAVLWANATQSIDPDALLGHLADAPPIPRAAPDLRAFVARQLEDAVNPRENTNYAFENVMLDGQLPRIDAYLSLYYDNQITQIGMERELYRALVARAPTELIADILSRPDALPIRAQVDAAAPSLTSGGGRSASLGVSTFFVCRRNGLARADDGYWVALMRRSSAVAVDKNRLHVVPAAMFECTYGDARREWSIRYNIERELLEELYCFSEATSPSHLIPDGIAGHPVIADLRALEAKGDCELSVTGISCSLLTRQIEVCTVLLVHDPGFIGRHPPSANWEYVRPDHGLTFFPVSELEQQVLGKVMTPVEITMPGLAAIRLAVDWLRSVRGIG